jgi:hypothetical protein
MSKSNNNLLENWKKIEKGLNEIKQVVEGGADKIPHNEALNLYIVVYERYYEIFFILFTFFSCSKCNGSEEFRNNLLKYIGDYCSKDILVYLKKFKDIQLLQKLAHKWIRFFEI